MAISKLICPVNPCKECIVRSSCQRRYTCEDAINYIKRKIMEFKPSGSPTPGISFLAGQIERIRKRVNGQVIVTFLFTNNTEVTCAINIKDLSVTSIERCKNE